MNDIFDTQSYRARLGSGEDQEYAIVTVSEHNSVTWLIVSAFEYNDCGYDDLPEDLLEEVNTIFGMLQFSGDEEE